MWLSPRVSTPYANYYSTTPQTHMGSRMDERRMWESAKQDPYSTSKRRAHALPRFGNMSQPFASRRRLSEQFMVYCSVGGTAATCLVLKGSPKACRKSVGSHSSLSVRSVMGGGRDQALEPGRQCLVHDGLLYVTKTDRSQGTSWGTWDVRRRHCGAQHDSAAVVQARSTAQHVAGAFGHRRGSKPKPIEGLGLTRAETLVSAASAGLARVDWCRDTTLNPFPWALCLLVWVASHEISQHQPVPKSVPVSAAIRAHGPSSKNLIVDKHA